MKDVQLFGDLAERVWLRAHHDHKIEGQEIDSGDSIPFYRLTDDEAQTVLVIAQEEGMLPEDIVMREAR